jgi:fibronectin type 3 domain-containing protein
VRLTWKAPGENSFRIFRKESEQKEPTLLGTSDKPEFVDTTTEYGKAYEYFLQGLHDKTESELAQAKTAVLKDIFPPHVPTGLTASVGVGSVDLAWDRNTDSDFKEYRVFRSEENGPFVQIAAGLEGPVYSDHNVVSGKHYRYRIVALDQVGNPSAPCEPIEVTVP